LLQKLTIFLKLHNGVEFVEHSQTPNLERKATEICPFLKSLQLYKALSLTAKINDQITVSPLLTSRKKNCFITVIWIFIVP
jgi:hypothetical protein